MGLCYSLSYGIAARFIFYAIVKVVKGKFREVSPILWVVNILFILNFIILSPVAKVTNLVATMEELKEKGLWFVCADLEGEVMYKQNLTGPIGLVIGSEGDGVSRLVREKCDFTAKIPMVGDIDSLNASVAMGILSYEIVRQRSYKK